MFDPKEFWLNKAEEFKKLKKIDGALECMEKVRVIENSKNKPNFWFENGFACVEAGHYKEAMECFDKHLEFNPPDFDVMFQKGIVEYLLKNSLEAIEYFNKAWELKYAEHLQMQEQVSALKDHKEYEKAIKYATKLNEPFSIPKEFWQYKGFALAEHGNYEKAIECFDKILSVNPNEPGILFEKSKCELLQGNENNCIELLKKACELDSNLKDRILSDVFLELKENKQIRQLIYK